MVALKLVLAFSTIAPGVAHIPENTLSMVPLQGNQTAASNSMIRPFDL
jgi:hypothetical protein